MGEREIIAELVQQAKKAQKEFEIFGQKEVDRIVRIVGKIVFDNAEELARMAVDETRMGNYEDKVAKNKGKSRIIWNSLRNKQSVGIIGYDDREKMYLVAKPKGVIALVTPCTNPIVTPMCNTMFALKGRNSVIIAPHPRAKNCGKYTVDLINKEIAKLGAPEDLIQIIEEPSIELTGELMKQADIVVATGGMGMVKAAYSSGHPAFGVGQGNVQSIIDLDADVEDAAQKIVAGRKFDNGIICSGEQSVIVPEKLYEKTIQTFISNGAYYIDNQTEIDKFRRTLFTEKGIINRDGVGQPVSKIAEMAGVEVPEGTKVILLKAKGIGTEDILCKEKMCPVMIAYAYSDFDEALNIAKTNLELEGSGHSVSIHSNTKEHIEKAGEILPVSRLVVNQICSTSAGGSFHNGFAPSTTLGCGSWGNNSISENLDYHHLINISRIGLYNEEAPVPADDEIWAEL